MASPEAVSRLEDILGAIAAISTYTSGKSFDDYLNERMLRDAVERNVERLSEASRHVPRSLKGRYPEIPWRHVADVGNVLRHAYPIVDDAQIWEVVVRDLPPLKIAVERILRELDVAERAGEKPSGGGLA
jgi:uncharacterized protein with HEPN domain